MKRFEYYKDKEALNNAFTEYCESADCFNCPYDSDKNPCILSFAYDEVVTVSKPRWSLYTMEEMQKKYAIMCGNNRCHECKYNKDGRDLNCWFKFVYEEVQTVDGKEVVE